MIANHTPDDSAENRYEYIVMTHEKDGIIYATEDFLVFRDRT